MEEIQSPAFFILTSCSPEFIDTEEERLCRKTVIEGKDTVPVISIDDIIFRNEHCAKCNNITEFQYFSLEYKGKQTGGEVLDKDLAADIISISSNVSFFLIPPTNTVPRMCVVIEDDKVDDHLCNRFQSPVITIRNNTPIIYRNEYCIEDDDVYFECFTGEDTRFDMHPLTVLIILTMVQPMLRRTQRMYVCIKIAFMEFDHYIII